MRRRIGKQLERQALQGVADQHRGRFVVLAMAARPATPGQGVVHGRKVVVDQRVAVNQLDRRARPQRARPRHLEQIGAGHHQKRPDALAAAEHGVAHGLVQPRLRAARLGQRPIEHRLDLFGHRGHGRAQFDHRRV